MSAGVSNDQLTDLLNTTKSKLPKNRFEMALDYQNYEVSNRWLRSDKVMVYSGTDIKENILLDDSGNAQFVRLFQGTDIDVADVQNVLTVPWVQLQTHWSIERREMLRNRAPAGFIRLLKSRKADGVVSMCNLLEERAWQTPDDSDDDLHPYGIPYWFPGLADSQAAEGFYGGSATGFTSTAGIDPATANDNKSTISGGKEKWRSYAAGGSGYYTSMNATAVRSMKKAYIKTDFKGPLTIEQMVKGPLSNYRVYMNADTQVDYETLAEQQNDRLGKDLASFQGVTAFRRAPVMYIAYLDTDTRNPIYMINHGVFRTFVQEGDYLREGKAMNSVRQHNVFTTFIDLSFAFLCMNRRRGGSCIRKTA